MKFEIKANDIDSSRVSEISFSMSESDSMSMSNTGDVRVVFQNNSAYLYHGVTLGSVIDTLFSSSVGQGFQKNILSKNPPYKKVS